MLSLRRREHAQVSTDSSEVDQFQIQYVSYKGHCHTEVTSRATDKLTFSLEKATKTDVGQQMEVRGGGLWLLLKGACTPNSLPKRQRHPGCPSISVQAEFWKNHCGWLPPMGGGTSPPHPPTPARPLQLRDYSPYNSSPHIIFPSPHPAKGRTKTEVRQAPLRLSRMRGCPGCRGQKAMLPQAVETSQDTARFCQALVRILI